MGKMSIALYELEHGDPSLLLEGVRRCLKDAKKPFLLRIFSGRDRAEDIVAAVELAERVAFAWRDGAVTLRGAEIYTLLRAYMKALVCMQEQPEYALDVSERAKMAGKLIQAFIPYVDVSNDADVAHTILRMKGVMVALDNKGVRCVDESKVFAFAEEVYRFWDAHHGHSNADLCLLAEELDHNLDGNSRAIMRAKRRLADNP